jgi:hypothetical protein
MRSRVLTAAVLSSIVCCPVEGAVILQTAGFGGSTYSLLGSSADGAGIRWTDAEAFAVSLGSHLTAVGSAAENAFLFNTFGSAQFGTHPPVDSIYIGFTDQAQEGNFVWSNGEPVTYTNWGPGEPNNTHGRENWGTIVGKNIASNYPDGTWNDVPNIASTGEVGAPLNAPLYAIMETPVPEPAAVTMLVLGLVSLFAYFWGWKQRTRATSRK